MILHKIVGDDLNDDITAEAKATIGQGMQLCHRQLDEDPELAADPNSRRRSKPTDNYGGKLFADPTEVNTPIGNVNIYPQRTNNILEQLSRGLSAINGGRQATTL